MLPDELPCSSDKCSPMTVRLMFTQLNEMEYQNTQHSTPEAHKRRTHFPFYKHIAHESSSIAGDYFAMVGKSARA